MAATSAAGEPGSRHAVATLMAPKTPIVAWQRCGMKVRVDTQPPWLGGDTMVILGTVLSRTSPRFISGRSEEHTSELQSLIRISYAVFCLKKKTTHTIRMHNQPNNYKQKT